MKKLQKSSYLRIFLILALILLPFGVLPRHTDAAALDKVFDTISDSRTSTDSDHLIQFVTTTGVAVDQTIIIKFDDVGDAFNLADVAFGDMDLGIDDDAVCDGTFTDETLAATATTTDWGVAVDTGSDFITFTAPSTGTPITANRCVQIEIGENATTGVNMITNPAAEGPFYIDIDGGTFADTGVAAIATVDEITASVTVDESLSFTVTAQTFSGSCAAVANTDGNVDTTDTTIPFATPTAENFIDACHALTVSTNASDGYQVTVVETDQLTSGTDQIADGDCTSSSCGISTAGAWGTNTDNGFAYCLIDVANSDKNSDFDSNDCDDATPWFKTFPDQGASDTPEDVMSNGAAVGTTTVDVGYRLSVPGDQVAGSYENNIIYVATPTY